MTTAHIFYIPMVLLAGIVAGFIMGRRAYAAQMEQEAAREARRAERRARRTKPETHSDPESPAGSA